MTAGLRERPLQAGAQGGGAPARRAVLRWALRLFRREWRQQLLVLTLITVAVAGTIFGAALGTNTPLPANAGFGSANALVNLPGNDPNLTSQIVALRAHFGPVDVIENQTFATGLAQGAQLRAQNPDGAYGRPMLALVTGHYPHGPGEVDLTSGLASAFRVGIGDTWHVDGRALRVTGIVQNPQNLLDTFALVAPGQVTRPTQVTVLLHATPLGVATFNLPPGAALVQPQPPSGLTPALIALAFAIVGLFFIGLVAVAGFTVLAQRRLRSLGILSSLGATDKHVRLVMVANGAVVGVVGAVLGGAIGLAAWIPYAPYFGAHADHVVAWTNLPWWLVVLAMVLAVVTAILASRQPARAVADVPVVAALSGRPAEPKQSRRSPRPGLAVLAVGIAAIAFSGGTQGGSGSSVFDMLAGLLATIAGLVLLAPVIIGRVALLAHRVPIGARIAVRDLARYRARSGAALAAATLAVFIAMLIALLTTNRYTEPLDYVGPNLPANQLVVYTPGDNVTTSSGDTLPTARQVHAGQATAATIAATLGTRNVLPLTSPVAPTDVSLLQAGPGGGQNALGIYVATPALLRHYGIPASAISHGTVLITSRPGLQGTPNLVLQYGNFAQQNAVLKFVANPAMQTLASLPTDVHDPNLLITASAAAKLGLRQATVAWLVQTPKPLTQVQISSARRVAAAAGLTIETKNATPSLSEVRDTSTAAGILVALGVLAMTIGLIRSETAGDIRTLTATGASARTRRGIVAATAGALGLLAALTGTVTAYVAVFASSWHELLGGHVSPVPWLDLAVVLIGLPVAAAAGGWLLAGREPRTIAHQPLE